jgi:ADP-ribose pyrophosphatase
MSTDNPWKTLGSKIAYQNPWIRVREDIVIRPDGAEGIYGVVECRKATGVVALTEDQEVYLVGQYRYTMEEYSWEIIEGGAEADEPPLEAAKRELAEEAGLIAKDWIALGGELHLTNCHSSERGWLYLATGLTTTKATPEGTEVLQLKKLPLADALTLVRDGTIKDAMSVIGLERAANFLSSNRAR